MNISFELKLPNSTETFLIPNGTANIAALLQRLRNKTYKVEDYELLMRAEVWSRKDSFWSFFLLCKKLPLYREKHLIKHSFVRSTNHYVIKVM